jgi:threonyl-tRNA synthetase
MNKGQKPMLPIWLSPTQIRFIPVGEEYISSCEQIGNDLKNLSEHYIIRYDIDDREHSVGRKIRDAEKEWIPIIIVIGEKENETKSFTPRFRVETIGDSNKSYNLNELNELVLKHIRGYPQELQPLPRYLSKRPRFK